MRWAAATLRTFRHYISIRPFSSEAAVKAELGSSRQCSFDNILKPSMTLKDYRTKYSHLQKGDRLPDVEDISLVGRVSAKREAGSKLVFLDIRGGNDEVLDRIQVIASPGDDYAGDFDGEVRALRRGDIVCVKGYPGASQRGELSIIPRQVSLLTPCTAEIPAQNELKDKELKYRKRSLDLTVNDGTRGVFIKRSKVIQFIRSFLLDKGFLEVETPILNIAAGGAAARPFKTRSWAFHNVDLSLRIAPELFLKELIVGGYERVFEIGKQFRNEGVDSNHNPEFTTLEFYQAYSNYEDLIIMAEDIIRGAVETVCPSSHVIVPAKDGSEVKVDFSQPFRKVRFLEALQEKITLPLPSVDNGNASIFAWRDLVTNLGGQDPKDMSIAQAIDEVFSITVEPTLHQPTFVLDHPRVLSPLARWKTGQPELSERFEFYIGGMELINAYSELNDPEEQQAKFAEQAAERDAEGRGGEAAGVMEESYCDALRIGMPPTGGFGLGIDRLVMLLTGQRQIRDVLLFPLMLPDTKHKRPTVEPQ